MQSRITSFVVPSSSLSKARAEREAADRALLEWQQARAASLGLKKWPPEPPRSRVGRPGFAILWKRAPEDSIREGVCPDEVQAEAPPWWKPGMAVFRSEDDQVADMELTSGPQPGDAMRLLEPTDELAQLETQDEDDMSWASPR